MKAIVRLKPELIGLGRADYGLTDMKGNHYTIKCAPGFIEVPINIAKELGADPRVTVEYPGEKKAIETIVDEPKKKAKKEGAKEEITKSTFTEQFIYSQNKAWQVDKIQELSGDKKVKIPRLEKDRVKLILKLQKAQ